MRIERPSQSTAKGWWVGAWNSSLPIAVGYANKAIDEPHVHNRVTEIHMVARGASIIRIEKQSLALNAGDLAIVEPGEAHTFVESSADYFHFVVHSPSLPASELRGDRATVARSRLGL